MLPRLPLVDVAGVVMACAACVLGHAPVLRAAGGGTPTQESARLAQCTGYPSRVVIARDGEAGPPLVVTGQVFAADGRTPLPGVTLYVYQTDATGLYHPQQGQPPRLRGWLTTDAQGRYEYRTIRPAPYPGNRIPAHIHTQLWGGGVPLQYNEELNFEDDQALRQSQRDASRAAGRFAWILAPEKGPDGVLRVTHNLRAKPSGDRLEESIMHGVRDCRPGTGS